MLLGLSNLSGNSPFKRSGNYASLRESALPSNIQRREQSRISLILEENTEEEASAATTSSISEVTSRHNDLNDLVSRVATTAGQDVTDSNNSGLSSLEVLSAERLQNQMNNTSSNSGSGTCGILYYNSPAGLLNSGLNDFAASAAVPSSASLWSSQIPANSNAVNNNSGLPITNNNNNGPEWRLPQLQPIIFETKLERPPVQVPEPVGVYIIGWIVEIVRYNLGI